MIAVGDGQLGPPVKGASVSFDAPQNEYAFSRSLAAPMCLALTRVTGLAYRLQRENRGRAVIPAVTGPTDDAG